ncbi:MAG: carboxypeptidase-like regulatory domain-containing protein [Segetibacter sp.]
MAFDFFINFSFSQGNNLIEISGTVENQQTKEPLQSVSVQIKGTVAGTITNNAGHFSIKTKNRFPLTLVFSSVGFEQQEFEVKSIASKLSVALVTQTVLGKEVVVTASRVAESILKSPVAIEKLDIRAIREISGSQLL